MGRSPPLPRRHSAHSAAISSRSCCSALPQRGACGRPRTSMWSSCSASPIRRVWRKSARHIGSLTPRSGCQPCLSSKARSLSPKTHSPSSSPTSWHGIKCFTEVIHLPGSRSHAKRRCQVLVNLQLRLRERFALSSTFEEQLALAAADAVGPLRAAAAVLLWLESGEHGAPREALRRIADQTGVDAALAAITEARESGGVPTAGATATLVGALELATLMAARAERLR